MNAMNALQQSDRFAGLALDTAAVAALFGLAGYRDLAVGHALLFVYFYFFAVVFNCEDSE